MGELRHRHQARQREIAELLRLKLSIREISQQLGKAPKIIKWHIKQCAKTSL